MIPIRLAALYLRHLARKPTVEVTALPDFEPIAGEVSAMAPDRAVNARIKLRFARKLAEATETGHLAWRP